MIICGYSAIGKSTLVNTTDKKCIDLESSLFRVNGVKDKNWYKVYTKIALDLSRQGCHVFVSAHKEVIEELKKVDKDFVVIYPSLNMKNEWLRRLNKRYKETSSLKDLCALKSAKNSFEIDIQDLINDKDIPHKIELNTAKYDLVKLIGW